MDYKYGICRIAIAPLRADPSDRAEMVSQLLFGDCVQIIEFQERWVLVENCSDLYQGWMDFKQLTYLSSSEYAILRESTHLAPLNFDNQLIGPDGSIYHITAGSTLPNYNNGVCNVGTEVFKVDFEPLDVAKSDFERDLLGFAKFFLNTPYLWGGRSAIGIDCSGFVQIVFKCLGINLRRDASQQAEQGALIGFLSASKLGDVAFFENEEGKIIHVGILLNSETIIHAAGKVRIDPIDDQGIFNRDLNKYTHKLRIVKRF